jgi:dinuclear metal center YbgI/SA1388 family protein
MVDAGSPRSTVADVCRLVESAAPRETAYSWDNVGLQVGVPDAPVGTVLLTLDLTPAVAEEAGEVGAELVIAHHPLLFRPPTSLAETDPHSRLVASLIRRNLAVYAAHTNLDVAPKIGVNAALAEALELAGCRPLLPLDRELMAKLVTFLPEDAVPVVRAALAQAGAGVIGEYGECSFATPGQGTFRGSEGAHPVIGEAGRSETVAEVRLEMVLPRRCQARAIAALLEAHPYEEPAFDVYPLLNNPRALGLGLVGELAEPMAFEQFCFAASQRLACRNPRAVPGGKETVCRVAVLGGSGGGEVAAAAQAGADAFVTGDVKYHDGLLAWELGLNILDAGHYATERPGLDSLAGFLRAESPLEVRISELSTDPFVGG